MAPQYSAVVVAGLILYMFLYRFFFVFSLWVYGYGLAQASSSQETLFLELDNDVEIPVEHYGDAKGVRLLWIPSEYGYESDRNTPFAEELGEEGFDLWQARLHDAYFQPAGRKSLTFMAPEDIAGLIESSVPDDGRKLFIMTSGRGAALTFMGLRHWLGEDGRHEALGGVLLLHPNFMASTPEPGRAVDYLSVIHDVALPVYILQPLGSGKRWYLPELTDQLIASGSHVYIHVLPGVRDGFPTHPEANEFERDFTHTVPALLMRASTRLGKDSFESSVKAENVGKEVGWSIGTFHARLQEYPGTPPAPSLNLNTVEDAPMALADYRGRVVVINFWATWCPPCVKEIPSLGRLQQKFAKEDLQVVSVDVGEDREQVQRFLEKVPANYPVMMDPDGKTVREWSLRAFPTTFVVDRQGVLRLAYFGGLEWDAPEVVEQLQDLLDE